MLAVHSSTCFWQSAASPVLLWLVLHVTQRSLTMIQNGLSASLSLVDAYANACIWMHACSLWQSVLSSKHTASTSTQLLCTCFARRTASASRPLVSNALTQTSEASICILAAKGSPEMTGCSATGKLCSMTAACLHIAQLLRSEHDESTAIYLSGRMLHIPSCTWLLGLQP